MDTKEIMLIVDDTILNRKTLCDIFKDSFEILEAEDGIQALKIVEQYGTGIAVIILDMIMPNKSGLEVLEEIYANKAYCTIPIIAYTSREEFQLQALKKGAWDYIIKSSGLELIRARVENVLAKKHSMIIQQETKMDTENEVDYLTGLLARRAFEEKVNKFLENSEEDSIFITMDISNMKKINDTYGHKEGEEIIRITTNLLRRTMGDKKCYIGRIGGDQFALFFPAVNETEAKKIMIALEQFCYRSRFTVRDEKEGMETYCCAGIAIAPKHGGEFYELYSNADNALLNAKANAKTYVVYERNMQLPLGDIAKNVELLLDEASDAIYICDVQTYELLYINQALKKIVGKNKNLAGKKLCYEYLSGKKEPCAYCKMHQMSEDHFLEREYAEDDAKQFYLLRGKQIEWAGRRAHIEYISDNTKQALLTKELQKQLKRKDLQVECTKYLVGIKDIGDALRAILKALSIYYCALNACLIEYETKSQVIINAFGCEKSKGEKNCLGKCMKESHTSETNCKYDFQINDTYSGCMVIREPLENREEIELLENICYFIKGELAKQFVEKELLQKTNQLQGTLKSLQSATVKCKNDENLTVVEANEIFWELTGYERTEFEQKNENKISSIVKSEIWEKTINEIARQLQQGKEIQVETSFVSKDGTDVYVIDKAILVTEVDGKEYWYRTLIDITEQEKSKMETERRYQHEIAYRTAMERTEMLGSFRANLNKNEIDECNYYYEGAEEMAGIRNFEQISQIIRQKIVNPANVKTEVFQREWLMNTFRNGENKMELNYQRYVNKNKINWVKTVIKMVKEPRTNDVIAFVYTYNIHKEKISDDIIAHAANKVYDLVTHIDTQSKELLCYVKGKKEPVSLQYMNENIYGELKDYFLDFEYKNVEDKLNISKVRKELENKEDYVFTILGKDKNGKEVCKKLHYSYLDKSKTTIMLVRTDVTDIYEQEQTKNEMLRHALTAAEQANKAKTKFLSSMSHDIRTPMNAIVGMAQIASMNLENKDKLKECMEVVTSSSNHLLGLINDVLDMSKIENGSMILAMECFSIHQLVDEIQTIILPEIEQKKQKLTVKFENIEHDKLLGDPIRLNRIFINILNNACKFTQNGGNICFEVEEQASGNTKIAEFKFMVSDNGKGIAKNNQKIIFEPFVREETPALEHVEGTGLGLSIVKSIVEASGGSIKLESEVGKGSCFIISIPLKIDFEKTKEVSLEKNDSISENKELNLSGMNILLVEDHPINVMVAKNLLSSAGATIEVAQNGAVGLERFIQSKEGEFQLIFMDIQMPIMNGYESAKEIRESKHPQAKTIPIIAMTANVFKEDVDMASEVGMNAHVGKPISVEAIARAISKVGIADFGEKN